MKKILIVIFFLFYFACQGSKYEWYNGSLEQAKEIAGSKLIMLKFYTNTWGACIRLDVETLRNVEVQDFSKKNFISLKYNASEELGYNYFKQYKCQRVPHLVFLDSEGIEVDRIIGFLPPTEYLLRIKDIAKKKNILNDFLARYEKGEKNIEMIAAIAMKYEDRNENDKAAEYYSILIKEYASDDSDYYIQAKFFLATYNFNNGDEFALKDYIASNPNSKFLLPAYRKMIFYYVDSNQLDKELEVYTEMLNKYPNDPNVLNSYAWRMAELEINLEKALIKVQKAIFLTKNDPDQANIIDTEAEIFWKLKRYDEAIKSIDRALFIDPDNKYFQDQKEKFLKSKIELKLQSV